MKEDTLFIFKFNTYSNALTWDAFEVILWIGIGMAASYMILPMGLAAIIHLFGLAASFGVWLTLFQRMLDPKNAGKNCWHDPGK